MEAVIYKRSLKKLNFSLKQVNNIFDSAAEGAYDPGHGGAIERSHRHMDEVQIADV